MDKPTILLVEDNEGDILLANEAVEDLELEVSLKIVKDGEKALRYVYKEGEFSNVTTPDIILLDINIPKVNGLEVVKRIKMNKSVCFIPVIMLTTSSSRKDIEQAYKNYANCYIVKPDDADGMLNTVQSIEKFWLKHAQLSTLDKFD